MADIELVIKISEETVNEIKDNIMFSGSIPSDIRWDVTSAIVKGKPLPKGYGRLIILSEDVIKREQIPLPFSCINWLSEVGLSNATVAIIEDKEGE